jgi:hypothetical protein
VEVFVVWARTLASKVSLEASVQAYVVWAAPDQPQVAVAVPALWALVALARVATSEVPALPVQGEQMALASKAMGATHTVLALAA